MSLIDAEDFSKVIKDYFHDMITHHKYNVDCVDCNADLQHLLDEQPTAYDVDKVVEELDNRSVFARPVGWSKSYELITLKNAVEVVKQGGVSDDVCEWKFASDGEFIQNPHTKRLYSNESSMKNVYCNTCGKKIKVVERMFDYEKDCCDDCLNCAYYWQNTDTENQCEGENEPCHEYIEFKGIGH